LKAYKNEKVIINGNKQLAHGIIINKECKYIKIENISIRNFTAYGVVMLGNNSYIYLDGLEITSCDTAIRVTEYAYSNVTADHIFIRNCYLCNNSLLGLDCAPGPVYDIYIYNTTSCNNGNGSNTAADGFAIESGNNITFEKCIAMQNAGDGFDSKASNTTVILCISKGNERNGIKLWEKNCSIVGSLSCLNGLAGIVLTEGGSYWLIGNTVARNGFYGDYGMYVAYDAPLYTYVYMRNNIFAFNYGGVYFGESVDLNENYKLYYSREDGEITADFTSHIYYTRQEINNKLWYNDTGNGFNDIAYDPLFVSTDDFHLSDGSPAIDNGTNEELAYDLDGNSRPYGNAYDIGAYEWQG